MSLVGQVFSKRYEIEREIARGGMAEVYLARDQSLSRPVALKALFPEFAREPSFVERFRREAQAAANLNHPNIVAIYDWGQQYGTYFIVMEYVEGRTLSEIIRTEGPLHPNRAAEVTADVAAALAFAHRNGVIHRDIKPGNLLVGDRDQTKILDFGLASTRDFAGSRLTKSGILIGSPEYMAPEQISGENVDARADLYSLGVVMYELLSGIKPFIAETPVKVLFQHLEGNAEPLGQRVSGLAPGIESLVRSAMARDPQDRPASAEALRVLLEREIALLHGGS
jgi:serine/threonine-protein kinase